MPQDVVVVQVGVGVEDRALAERIFKEPPTDKVVAGVRRGSVTGGRGNRRGLRLKSRCTGGGRWWRHGRYG
jgi:hypothetical protein